MSQPFATARVAHRQPGRLPSRQALRVIRGTVDRPRSGVFVVLCLAVLMAGAVLVLVLNTSMAKGSFVLHDLQGRSDELADRADAIQHAIDAQSAPAVLAQRAMRLGMVPSGTAAFLDLQDGKVSGVAKPAKAVPGFKVVTAPAPTYPPEPPKITTKRTVVKQGTVTTTTVVVRRGSAVIQTTVTRADTKTKTTTVVVTRSGVVTTTVTRVDPKTGTTTTTRTVKKVSVTRPPATKPGTTKPGATTAGTTKPAAATPTGTATTAKPGR